MITGKNDLDFVALADEAEETTYNLGELNPATEADNERHFRAFIVDRLDEINAKLDKLAMRVNPSEAKTDRLSNEEYALLAEEYASNPPAPSGHPGYITQLKQRELVTELLDPDYARVVNAKASALHVSPTEVIQSALKGQFAEAV